MFMRTFGYIIELAIFSGLGGYSYEAFERLLSDLDRIKEENYYATITKRNFPRGVPCPHSDLNKNYLLRRQQDRYNHNHSTKMPLNGLQKKMNNDTRETKKQIKAYKEKKIKEAFARS